MTATLMTDVHAADTSVAIPETPCNFGPSADPINGLVVTGKSQIQVGEVWFDIAEDDQRNEFEAYMKRCLHLKGGLYNIVKAQAMKELKLLPSDKAYPVLNASRDGGVRRVLGRREGRQRAGSGGATEPEPAR